MLFVLLVLLVLIVAYIALCQGSIAGLCIRMCPTPKHSNRLICAYLDILNGCLSPKRKKAVPRPRKAPLSHATSVTARQTWMAWCEEKLSGFLAGTLWLFDPYWGPACGPFACGWPLELQSTSEVHLSSATSDRSWHGEMLANISDHWLTLAKPPKLEILECEKGTVFVKGFSMIGSLRQLHLAKHGRSAQAAAGQIIIVQKQTTPVAIENKATKRIAWA